MAPPAIVFSPAYDITFLGLERLHPFDSRKYGRAWAELRKRLGAELSRHHHPVDRPASDAELALAHTPEYLASLRRSSVLAAALEVPLLGYLPGWLIRWRVVTPMRWAVRGTVLAAKSALKDGLAFNLSGGYHHAKPDHGEGFCLFNDIAVAVRQLRCEGCLPPTGRVAYIDLDAHQGNGVSHQFRDDPTVFLFDVYNPGIYPAFDIDARARVDCAVPVESGCDGDEYLARLRERLPPFLDSVGRGEPVALAVYNAGTDVVEDDPLGLLSLTPADVLARDLFVSQTCRERGIPMVMLPSGGYTRESYRLLAASVEALVRG